MIRLSLLALALGAAAMLALVGCGKKSELHAPDGKEKEYTYPRQYPR